MPVADQIINDARERLHSRGDKSVYLYDFIYFLIVFLNTTAKALAQFYIYLGSFLPLDATKHQICAPQKNTFDPGGHI